MYKETVEAIENQLRAHEDALVFNVGRLMRHLLWELVLESEAPGRKGPFLALDIDKVVDKLVRTSRYAGPTGEEYPFWDEKEVEPEINRIKEALVSKGFDPKYWEF